MGRLIAKILAWLAILLGLALLIQPTAAQWWTSTRNAKTAAQFAARAEAQPIQHTPQQPIHRRFAGSIIKPLASKVARRMCHKKDQHGQTQPSPTPEPPSQHP